MKWPGVRFRAQNSCVRRSRDDGDVGFEDGGWGSEREEEWCDVTDY